MAWLDDWAYRTKITIDSTKIDVPLSDFPVHLSISEKSGTNDQNLDFILERLSDPATMTTPSGLVGHLTMDGFADGIVQDIAGGGYDGVMSYDASITDTASVRGHKSFKTARNNYRSRMTINKRLIRAGQPGAVSIWFKTGKKVGSATILANPSASSGDIHHIYLNSTGNIAVKQNLATTINGGWNDYKWHHLVITWDIASDSREIWVDGVHESVDNANQNFVDDSSYTQNFYLGASQNDIYAGNRDHFLNGLLDELMIFDRKLTGPEILGLYRGTSPKKIAITSADGLTKLPVELEVGGNGNKLDYWFKAPYIDDSTDTEFYVYYDITKDDNVNWVGEAGSNIAAQVWTNSFEAVYHFSNSPTVDATTIYDSTSNSNNGIPRGSIRSRSLEAGKVGNCLYFDGNGDYIDLDPIVSMTNLDYWTAEVVTMPMHTVNYDGFVTFSGAGIASDGTRFSVLDNTDVQGVSLPYQLDTFQYVVATNQEGVYSMYLDNVKSISAASSSGWDIADQFKIGYGHAGYNPQALMGEVRLSSVVRSDAWIKATYHTINDDLLKFDDNLYYYDGYITLDTETPVSRIVRLYNRNSGKLIEETTSRASDGYYRLNTYMDDQHYIVVLDDDDAVNYNALISDRLLPKGTL